MHLLHAANELQTAGRKVCLAIGVFDGVHLGHQQVIRQTVSDAQQHESFAVVVTFDRHPNSVVAPQRAPALIYSLSQKMRVIESLGTDAILLIRFDHAFSETPADAFIRDLVNGFGNVYSICVGSTFTFGHKRTGNVELLKTLGAELGFSVHGLAAVSLDGQRVSSTRIRQAIRAGNLDAASQMLGRPYSLAGQVIAGDKLGRQLGIPTANINVTGLTLPPLGVHAAHALFREKSVRAVVNIGRRPTVPGASPETRVEAHLLDFSAEIYGEDLEIVFVEKLRDERRFSSLEALKTQIRRDIELAKTLF